jgi:hypothetical protein
MIGTPLDKTCIQEVDICHYLGHSSSHPSVARLYLDPAQYDEPPFNGDPITSNPHWIQLKEAIEAASHTSGSPLMCNGGKTHNRTFQCKLWYRLYHKSKFEKDGAPRQDDCINMDKGGRRPEG